MIWWMRYSMIMSEQYSDIIMNEEKQAGGIYAYIIYEAGGERHQICSKKSERDAASLYRNRASFAGTVSGVLRSGGTDSREKRVEEEKIYQLMDELIVPPDR